MTQAFLDLWMRQSSQGETQSINRDLSEKMMISEIESKHVSFVDITDAFQRVCAPSRLPHIEVTPHQGYPPSRLPPIQVTQLRCKLSRRKIDQEVFIYDKNVSGFVDETAQSGRNPIHQQRPKRTHVDFWDWKQQRGFRLHNGCIPKSLCTIKGFPTLRLPFIKATHHRGCSPYMSSSFRANCADAT